MKKHARKASMSNFKMTPDKVLEKIDERFNRQEEFNMTAHSQMQDEIRKLGGKIDMQINTFNVQLSKLNDNMEKALSTLADHEQRITALEVRNHDAEITKTAKADFMQKAVAAAKSFWWLLVVLGAAYGVKPFLKVFNLFSE